MTRFTTVLLDVDGTLVDSNDAHAHAWVETLARFGHVVPFDQVRRLIGMGGDRLIETVTKIPKDDERSEAISEARSKHFREAWLQHVKPLPGSRDLVLRLRDEGIQYAIASAAKDDELEPLLGIANIRDLAPRRTSSSDVEESKPAPDTIHAALSKLDHVDRTRVVMVGDTPYDARAARDARVAFIGVTTGGWDPDELTGAVGVYAGPAELASVFPF